LFGPFSLCKLEVLIAEEKTFCIPSLSIAGQSIPPSNKSRRVRSSRHIPIPIFIELIEETRDQPPPSR
jgi:hypothetical protein